MVNFFQATINAVQERSYAQHPIPPIFNKAAHLFKEAHLYWWSFKYYQIAQNAAQRDVINQGNPLIYGAAAYGLAQHFTLANCLVQMSLIAKCADDLFQSYQRVSQAYKEFNHAIQIRYPVYHRQKWLSLNQKCIAEVSPSACLNVHLMHIKFTEHLIKVVKCTVKLISELFRLSMCLRDTYLIATQDPIAQHTACSEVFVHWNQYRKRLSQDHCLLLNELKKRQNWTNYIMTKLESNEQGSQFILAFRSSFEELTQLASPHFSSLPSLEEFFEPLLHHGKISPLTLTFERDFKPSLPLVCYPPWNGQKVKLKVEKKIKNPIAKQANEQKKPFFLRLLQSIVI